LRYYDGENAILVCEPNTIFFLNKKDRYCRAFNPIQLARSNSVIFNVFYLLDTKLYPFASAKCTTQRIEINRYDYTKDVLYISLLENSFNKKEGALGQKDFNTLQNILLDKSTKVVKTTRAAPVDEPTLYKDVPIWTF
jgi:hypothetical protein